jgi:ribosomal protein L6P/L9E
VLYRIPKNIGVSVHMKKRRFFIYGFNYERISKIAFEIVSLKYPNLFKGKGLRIVNLKYRKKLVLKKTK